MTDLNEGIKLHDRITKLLVASSKSFALSREEQMARGDLVSRGLKISMDVSYRRLGKVYLPFGEAFSDEMREELNQIENSLGINSKQSVPRPSEPPEKL